MKGLRRLALMLGAGLAAALAVELGYRGWLAVAGEAYDSGDAERELALLVEGIDRDPAAFTADEQEHRQVADDDPMAGAHTHPFWGWSFEVLDRRFDNFRKVFRADREDTFDVLVLGGSVAQLFFFGGRDRLAEQLAVDPRLGQRPVRIISLASGAFKQPQQVNLLTQAFNMGWAPEVVINLDGFNELALSVQNGLDSGAHPLHPSFSMWGPTTPIGRIDRDQLERLIDMRAAQKRSRRLQDHGSRWRLGSSAVLGTWVLGRVRATAADYDRAYERYTKLVARAASAVKLTGPPFDEDFESLLALSVEAWFESSISLHSLSAARGSFYLHVLQPTLHDEGSKPLTPAELENGRAIESWSRAIREGYPRLRAEGERLRSRGIAFFDASGVFRDVAEELYFDACHFEVPGNDLLVDALAEALLASLPADLSELAPGD